MLKSFIFGFVSVFCLVSGNALSATFAPSTPFDDCVRGMEKVGPVGDYEYAVCMKKESARLLTEIQKLYTEIANDTHYSKWNNGKGMFKGRVRDTYNAWLVYRNNYCDLLAEAAKNSGGSEDYNREQCRMELSQQQLKEIQNVISAQKNDPE